MPPTGRFPAATCDAQLRARALSRVSAAARRAWRGVVAGGIEHRKLLKHGSRLYVACTLRTGARQRLNITNNNIQVITSGSSI